MLQPYQQRVIEEKAGLDEKIAKLDAFRHGQFYSTVPKNERLRLTRQYCFMKDYSNVLGERIAAFSGE